MSKNSSFSKILNYSVTSDSRSRNHDSGTRLRGGGLRCPCGNTCKPERNIWEGRKGCAKAFQFENRYNGRDCRGSCSRAYQPPNGYEISDASSSTFFEVLHVNNPRKKKSRCRPMKVSLLNSDNTFMNDFFFKQKSSFEKDFGKISRRIKNVTEVVGLLDNKIDNVYKNLCTSKYLSKAKKKYFLLPSRSGNLWRGSPS